MELNEDDVDVDKAGTLASILLAHLLEFHNVPDPAENGRARVLRWMHDLREAVHNTSSFIASKKRIAIDQLKAKLMPYLELEYPKLCWEDRWEDVIPVLETLSIKKLKMKLSSSESGTSRSCFHSFGKNKAKRANSVTAVLTADLLQLVGPAAMKRFSELSKCEPQGGVDDSHSSSDYGTSSDDDDSHSSSDHGTSSDDEDSRSSSDYGLSSDADNDHSSSDYGASSD
jgi:hypothetical protein